MNDRPSASDIARWTANYADERQGAALYESLAAAEKDTERAAILRRLASVEARHAARWEEKLRVAGVEPPRVHAGLQGRSIAWLARRIGVEAVLPLVRGMELRAVGTYEGQPDAADFIPEERRHARTLAALAQGRTAVGEARTLPPGDVAGGILEREPRHRRDNAGSLRAAVFGVNDGLVSNLSLVLGVAGADPDPRIILLTGIAGLLAGAFSMAAGEYVSVSAQRELFERQIALEREELRANPEEEQEELSLLYQAKGVPALEAEQISERLMADPAVALDTLVREELGLDPGSLGSPWAAAGSSLTAFAAGAVIPVLPYMFTSGATAFVVSAIISALALAGVGATLTLFTGRNPLVGAARMVGIGALAASVTFAVGRLIGVNVGG
jgi:vacuolar iron transporter family protein